MPHHGTVGCIRRHTKETISALMDKCKEQSCWTCQKCVVIMKKLNGRLTVIEKDVTEVKANIQEIQTKQDTTDGVVAQLQDSVSEVVNLLLISQVMSQLKCLQK